MDEAGRGPLAGPVVAAAVILPLFEGSPRKPKLTDQLSGLNDSKKLTAPARLKLFDDIVALCDVSIASLGLLAIERMNIRGATLAAMKRAIEGLQEAPSFALIDGNDQPAGLPCAAAAVVKGDSRSVSIAAASICAKVARDRMMEHADRLYPGYGFGQHKGYATAAHREALARLGPCPLHRRDFAPVQAALKHTIPST